MMIKVAGANAYSNLGLARVALVKKSAGRRLSGFDLGELVKRADEEFATKVRDMEVKSGEELVHLIALGSTEFFGPNRNGDGFTAETCGREHGTFVKHARMYRDHVNHDPARSYGVIKLSNYNPRTGRVELIAALNATKEAALRNGGLVADEELEDLYGGREFGVSMATRVPYDVCSHCQKQAKTRADYCTEDTCKAGGLKYNIGRVLDDGSQLHADNPIVKWYDMSKVGKPADPTAFVLAHLKQAAAGAAGTADPMGGARLAEELGVSAPWEVFFDEDPVKGAAAMRGVEKIARESAAVDRDFYTACGVSGPLPPGGGERLVKLGIHGTLALLADHGVLLTPAEFTAFVAHDNVRARPSLPEEVAKCAASGFERFLRSDEAITLAAGPEWLAESRRPFSEADHVWAAKAAMTHGLLPQHRRERLVSTPTADPPAAEKVATAGRPGIAETINMHYCLYATAFVGKHASDRGICRAAAARAMIR